MPDQRYGQFGGRLEREVQAGEPWQLRLFVAGFAPSSLAAINNAKLLEAEHLPPGSKVEIIDLLEHPEIAAEEHILAIPMLVRLKPGPLRRVVGSLSDIPKALKGLGLQGG